MVLLFSIQSSGKMKQKVLLLLMMMSNEEKTGELEIFMVVVVHIAVRRQSIEEEIRLRAKSINIGKNDAFSRFSYT